MPRKSNRGMSIAQLKRKRKGLRSSSKEYKRLSAAIANKRARRRRAMKRRGRR